MFDTNDSLKVILIAGVTDMRKSIDGLSAHVAYFLEQEPCSDKLFVFCNRYRDKIKILQWSKNGFWLHYKRLEEEKFLWSDIEDEERALAISQQQLRWLLEGLPLTTEQKAHTRLCYHYD